eukprot:TRINITY_DN234_c0_g1_i2.p1 TRINITY_DN234_c0_g1~~TRINITY_DN234_c0_g1_i2.p1  ORF type:complete len:373 (+),score=44.10 TRINITY_DN234_c0_g1_i2:650-1768(+)
MDGLCSYIGDKIYDALPGINDQLSNQLAAAVDQALAELQASIPSSFPIGPDHTLSYQLTTNTCTDDNGFNAMGAGSIAPNGVTPSGPYAPTPALPDATQFLSDSVDLSILLSDSLINNAIWTQYGLSNWTFSFPPNSTAVVANITQAPFIHFSSQPGTNATSINITGSASVDHNSLQTRFDFTALAHAALSVNSSGFVVITVSPDLDLYLSNSQPPVPLAPIAAALRKAFQYAAADINAMLQANAPHLPLAGTLTVSDGYAVFQAQMSGAEEALDDVMPDMIAESLQVIFGTAQKALARAFQLARTGALLGSGDGVSSRSVEVIGQSDEIQCPDLSALGAHLDDCSFGALLPFVDDPSAYPPGPLFSGSPCP